MKWNFSFKSASSLLNNNMVQKRDGASKVILEDPDSVSILDMVKEKLHGQMMAGLLSGSREGAVRVSLDNLTRLLQGATKKRSVNPNLLLSSGSDSESKGTQRNLNM